MAPMQFCTTSSRRYLPYARALGETIRATNPDSTLWVLLTDDHHHTVDRSIEPFRGVWNEEIGIDPAELHRRFIIHAEDFHIAIKPWICEFVLNETGGPVMFIDSDIHLYGPLDDVAALIEAHGVVLTPHMRAPLPLDDMTPDDTTILGAGTFNAGMVGVGEHGRGFLEFWKSRLRRECFVDVAQMRVGEQRWLDFVPSLFECHVLRDPGVNAAYWNLHERPLSRDGGVVMAGERPLRAFHFSGHDVVKPTTISRHMVDRPRFLLETEPILQELCAAYGARILAQRFEESQAIPVDFATLPNGMPITAELRERFRQSVIAAEKSGGSYPPDPYDPAESEAFIAWAQRAFAAVGLGDPMAGAVTPEGGAIDLAELLRTLAVSSSTALANIDVRLRAIEEHVALVG
jgi:hypothetical protein